MGIPIVRYCPDATSWLTSTQYCRVEESWEHGLRECLNLCIMSLSLRPRIPRTQSISIRKINSKGLKHKEGSSLFL